MSLKITRFSTKNKQSIVLGFFTKGKFRPSHHLDFYTVLETAIQSIIFLQVFAMQLRLFFHPNIGRSYKGPELGKKTAYTDSSWNGDNARLVLSPPGSCSLSR